VNIIFQYSPWLVLLCILLGAIYAFLLYRKDKRLAEFSKNLIGILASLRFITATFLALLLLSPLVKYLSREVEEPLLIIAFDRSTSVLQGKDSTEVRTDISEELKAIESRLAGKVKLQSYYFGEEFRKASDEDGFTDRYSNFEQLFNEVDLRYENRNLAGMLLISDGIYNRGLNPLYSNQNSNYPIYTVGLGDTSQRRDLLVDKLTSNKIAFLGNTFPIQVNCRAEVASGLKSTVDLYHRGKRIESKKVEFNSNQALIEMTFLVEAKQPGLQTYTVQIRPVEGEINKDNNQRNVYVDVLDGRQNILLLYSSPHPDLSAIQQSISRSENYQLSSRKWEGKADLDQFDLIILYDLMKKDEGIEYLLSAAKEESKPVWHLLSARSDWSFLNSIDLPFKVSGAIPQTNEVFPIYEEAFPLFKLSEVQQKSIAKYPPLEVPQLKLESRGRSYDLLLQKIGSVPTRSPLLTFITDESQKTGVLLGEGIWRWRLDNYLRFNDHEHFDRLISKIVQYLSVKSDKSYLRISHAKEAFENEELRFDLQLFNKAYEPINDRDAFFEFTDEEGNQFKYQFNRSESAYYLDLEGLSEGIYNYKAYAELGGQKLEEKGEFRIQEIKVESTNLKADHNLLFQLSEKSGGALLYDLDAEVFADSFLARKDVASISYTTEEVKDIINLKWIFFLLVGLISLEWFIRKYQGAY